ncbi:hypothetical protein SRB5_38130 [Streptomyces sp. RB5]|uniref:Tetratricopeptide repeat protein n=1 Tax=Streptomyces smaragdinus TaxID=2585196 RepID=A0A7K0CKA2_9ACTN|nr:FxSxx-COOH system tetratricopeptide repeat protein [Streptomyces smaragdinus]MQY13663.1 hypothetical protein [Streptomyces smaragdinus]
MSPQQAPSGEETRDYLVVFPGFQRHWATWVLRILESHGHRATMYRWDPPREKPLQGALSDLLLAEAQVVLVLSQWFFQLGPRPEGDWDDVLRGFVREHKDRFAAVNVSSGALPPAAGVVRPAELWGIDAGEAERRLLTRLELPTEAQRALAGRRPFRYPSDPPEVWGDVPRRNPAFTGRDELLGDLGKRLTDAQAGAAVCALVGMPGIGKTQIVAEYAHRYSAEYDVVWWVNAESPAQRRERFGQLATRLDLPTDTSGPGERIRAVREALRIGAPYLHWLIIFDGWDDLRDLDTLVPVGSGHVLVTARNRQWGQHADMIEVSGFNRAESTGFLMRRARRITSIEAERVADRLEHVPLALSQAAAYLDGADIAVEDYLRQTESGYGAPELAEEEATSYPASSLMSWSLLINQLRQENPRAVDLLALCTGFASGRIPLGLVRQLPDRDLPEGLRWLGRDPAAWSKALEALANFSVVTLEPMDRTAAEEPDSVEIAVRMHRLVHSIVNRLLAPEGREVHRRVVRRALAEADPGHPQNVADWPRYADLMLHLEPSGALRSTNRRIQHLVVNCLGYCMHSGEYALGAALAAQVREAWHGMLDPGDPLWFKLTQRQSRMLRDGGRLSESYALDEAQLARLQAEETPNEAELASTHSALAADLRRLGRYTEALEHQERALAYAERLYGPDDQFTLSMRGNRAVTLRLLGRYAEAYETDVQELRVLEVVLPPRDRKTLLVSNNVAFDLRLLGRFQEALTRQQQGTKLQVQTLGRDHVQTLLASRQLALCQYRAGGARDETGAVLGSLLDRFRRAHGRRAWQTLILTNDYSCYLREQGQLDDALALAKEAEEGFRALLGTTHPVSTGLPSNIGLILRLMGDRSGALNLFEQSLAGMRALLGERHPWTLGCALNATMGRNASGRLREAADLSRRTMTLAREVLGEDHPLTLSATTAVAADLRALQELEEATTYEEEALQRLNRTMGAQHPHTVDARKRVRPYWDFEANLG